MALKIRAASALRIIRIVDAWRCNMRIGSNVATRIKLSVDDHFEFKRALRPTAFRLPRKQRSLLVCKSDVLTPKPLLQHPVFAFRNSIAGGDVPCLQKVAARNLRRESTVLVGRVLGQHGLRQFPALSLPGLPILGPSSAVLPQSALCRYRLHQRSPPRSGLRFPSNIGRLADCTNRRVGIGCLHDEDHEMVCAATPRIRSFKTWSASSPAMVLRLPSAGRLSASAILEHLELGEMSADSINPGDRIAPGRYLRNADHARGGCQNGIRVAPVQGTHCRLDFKPIVRITG